MYNVHVHDVACMILATKGIRQMWRHCEEEEKCHKVPTELLRLIYEILHRTSSAKDSGGGVS